jgi:biopolymer transport protein ExbD
VRIRRKGPQGIVEGDMTPMIDCAFQLISFFMFVINFNDAEQDQRVTLPASELAKPPVAPYDYPLTIHLTRNDHFIYGGRELTTFEALQSELLKETQIIKRLTSRKVPDVTVIIRADEDAKTGMVQRVIQTCQKLAFEKFALRGKQSEIRTLGGG